MASVPWLLGISNGVLALAAVNGAFSALSGNISFVPLWAALPPTAFTAWRAQAYVRRLLNRETDYVIRPLVEGFCLMALSTLGYGAYMTGIRDVSVDALPIYALFAVPVGCFGSAVAGSLMVLDWSVVSLGNAVKKRRAPGEKLKCPIPYLP